MSLFPRNETQHCAAYFQTVIDKRFLSSQKILRMKTGVGIAIVIYS